MRPSPSHFPQFFRQRNGGNRDGQDALGFSRHSGLPPLFAFNESTAIISKAINLEVKFMAVLTIRNLPDEVRDRLRLRAAKAGRSMEAEVRDILARASLESAEKKSPEEIQNWVKDLYANRKPENVVDDLIRDRRREAASEQRTGS